VYVGYLCLCIGIALLAGNGACFIISRFFIGCAGAWFGTSVPLLINEIAYPSHRGVASALFMCGWYVGGSLAAFITFGMRDVGSDWAWRVPALLQLLLPLVALPGFFLIDESPRWLISAGRIEDASGVLTRVHAGGVRGSALVEYEMAQITEAITAEKELQHSHVGYAEMLKTPGNRKRLFISITIGEYALS
jgi:MFS family permease